MIHIHLWLYQRFKLNGIYPTIFSPNLERTGDKRICRVCGLVQETGALLFSWQPIGYAEDKEAVIQAWKVGHQEEKSYQEAYEKRLREKKRQKIPTSDLVKVLKVGEEKET